MAIQTIHHVRIAGISAAVPKQIENNIDLQLLGTIEERQKFIDTTGIRQRHIVGDSGLCSSDLCYEAARKLIAELNWDINDIDCLVFVSQTPDYILPTTSCILQERLGLSQDCFTLDISLGCSGWIYGLSTISSLISASRFKKALLLVGDTVTVTKSPKDKSTYPLFGDAGTATALIYDENAPLLQFHMGSDGSNAESIIIRDGGFRYPYSEDSLLYKDYGDGIIRNNLQSALNGAQVFTFGITKVPKSIKTLLSATNSTIDEIDFVLLHQANVFMNNKIAKKIGAATSQVPYCIEEYGNTSCASIPLTLVSRLNDIVRSNSLELLACGFGVGFSWGSVLFNVDHIVCPAVIEI